MKYIPAVCPNCNGELVFPKGKEMVTCTYCGVKFFLFENKKEYKSINFDNLLELAQKSYLSGNFLAAEYYSNKALEIDTKCYDAWVIKGLSIGYQSTFHKPRIYEMKSIITNAFFILKSESKIVVKNVYSSLEIKNRLESYLNEKIISKNYDADDFKNTYNNFHNKIVSHPKVTSIFEKEKRLAEDILSILKSFYALSYSTFINNITSNNISFIYKQYQSNSSTIISNGTDFIIDIIPIPVLKFKIEIFRDLYKDRKTYLGKLSINNDWKVEIQKVYKDIVKILQENDPEYVIPQLEEDENCFVVTATMGDCNHPYVIFLRKFRDYHLLQSDLGTRMVSGYYRIGPQYANLINHSRVLRWLCYHFVIRPIVWLITKFCLV